MRAIPLLKFALLTPLLAAAFMSGCAKKPPPQEAKRFPVKVGEAVAQPMPYVIRTIGSVKSDTIINVLPQVNGQLLKWYFAEGDLVEKDQLIGKIDPRPYEAALEEAIGQLAQARATLAFNLEVVERYRELLPSDYVAMLTYDQFVSNVETSQGQVEQFEGAVAAAQVNLGWTSIYSPVKGKTGIQFVDEGNVVSSTQTQALVTINQLSPILVTFTVPQRYFPEIQLYSGEKEIEVEATFMDDVARSWVGKLTMYDNQIDLRSGTLYCQATMPNEDATLWPGLFLNIVVKLYEIPNAVVVPARAIGIDTQGEFLFVVKEDSTADLRRIQIGQRFADLQVVNEGLKAGEFVVTEGQALLSPGSEVEIQK